MQNTLTYIDAVNKIHNNAYIYNDTIYTTSHNDIIIKCKIHGVFKIKAYAHKNGQGCRQCGIIKASSKNRFNTKSFISMAVIKHGDIYDYSLVEYINSTTKIKIICKEHGVFEQSPSAHKKGQGCPTCALGGYSKISLDWLETISKSQNIYIQHAGNIGEYRIPKTIIDNDNRTGIKVDGYCKKTIPYMSF